VNGDRTRVERHGRGTPSGGEHLHHGGVHDIGLVLELERCDDPLARDVGVKELDHVAVAVEVETQLAVGACVLLIVLIHRDEQRASGENLRRSDEAHKVGIGHRREAAGAAGGRARARSVGVRGATTSEGTRKDTQEREAKKRRHKTKEEEPEAGSTSLSVATEQGGRHNYCTSRTHRATEEITITITISIAINRRKRAQEKSRAVLARAKGTHCCARLVMLLAEYQYWAMTREGGREGEREQSVFHKVYDHTAKGRLASWCVGRTKART